MGTDEGVDARQVRTIMAEFSVRMELALGRVKFRLDEDPEWKTAKEPKRSEGSSRGASVDGVAGRLTCSHKYGTITL